MSDYSSITPPLALIDQWWDEAKQNAKYDEPIGPLVAAKAAQWGADQELEACCEHVDWVIGGLESKELRVTRRPKPQSLKEEAMQALCRFMAGEGHDDCTEEEIEDDFKTIRRALEALND